MILSNPAPFEISVGAWNAKTQIEQIRYIAELKRRQTYVVTSVVQIGDGAGTTRHVECKTATSALVEMADTIEMQNGSESIVESIVECVTTRVGFDAHRQFITSEISS